MEGVPLVAIEQALNRLPVALQTAVRLLQEKRLDHRDWALLAVPRLLDLARHDLIQDGLEVAAVLLPASWVARSALLVPRVHRGIAVANGRPMQARVKAGSLEEYAKGVGAATISGAFLHFEA